MNIIFFVFSLAFFVHLSSCSPSPPAGDIGFIVEIKVMRTKTGSGSGCKKTGDFEYHYFPTTHGNTWLDLAEIASHEIPSSSYKLTWDNEKQWLEHNFHSSGMYFPSSTKCTVQDDDFEQCTVQYEGQVSTNCHHKNVVSFRRLKFRFCPAAFYFQGKKTRMCEHCPDSYYSEDMNTDLECKFCKYPTQGDICLPECPPGGYIGKDGYCHWCPPGTFSNTSQARKCYDCDIGTYNDEEKQTQCKPCKDYNYADETKLTKCKVCKHITNGRTCKKCEKGKHWESGDFCVDCEVGKYKPSEDDATSCLSCKDLSKYDYQDEKGKDKCKKCSHETKEGTKCEVCQKGKEYNVKTSECDDCLPGHYQPSESDEKCKKCLDISPYYYQPNKGKESCEKCQWKTDGVNCCPPCPYDASETRGTSEIHTCICPQITKDSNVFETSAYSDDSNLCLTAYYEGLITEDGGYIEYKNGALSYSFNSSSGKEPSVEFVGEGSHKHKVKVCENKVIELEHDIIELETKMNEKEILYSKLYDELIEKINSDEKSTWKARKNSILYDGVDIGIDYRKVNTMTWDELQKELEQYEFLDEEINFSESNDNFDPRDNYPKCPFSINTQDACGSCFAFAVSQAMSLRFCMNSSQSITEKFSVQDILNCGNFKCSGGFISDVFSYYEKKGSTSEKCTKYYSGKRGDDGFSCSDKCDDGSTKKQYYAKIKSSTRLKVSSAIRYLKEIGPIAATFSIYEDFLVYSSGVYQHKTGSYLFLHAITIIGYGTEDGVDYWLAMNSWGTDFGMDGFFKIKRGHLGIDEALMMALPDFTR